jgi:DNA-binding NtrC family response regulator
LNAASIRLPPLRERRADILFLAKNAAERVYSLSPQVKFSQEVIELFEQYPWPGNIRELENAVVLATAVSDSTIRIKDLPNPLQTYSASQAENQVKNEGDGSSLEDTPEEHVPLSVIEGRHVARVLAYTGGNKQAAARLLNVDRKTLDRMIKRHKISGNTSSASQRQ